MVCSERIRKYRRKWMKKEQETKENENVKGKESREREYVVFCEGEGRNESKFWKRANQTS